MIIKCACGCGNELEDKDSKGRTRKYITFHFNKTLKGKPRSEETRRKISQKNSQRIHRPEEIERCRLLAKARIGKHLTNEHKKKLSEIFKGRPPWNKGKVGIYKESFIIPRRNMFSGPNNPKWNGGIYPIIYDTKFSSSFKNTIRKLDNYQCRLCNINQSELNRKLSIHHIDKNKKNSVVSNCVSLCDACHNRLHILKLDLTDYFKKIVDSRQEVIPLVCVLRI